MANTINIPKAHLMVALCLPLAVLLGYFLAEPVESGSMAVVVLVIAVLALPLLIKFHHPLLILSWNAWIAPVFLPGQPLIWMIVAPVSLLVAVLNRSVKPDFRFLHAPEITKPLVALVCVVVFTAMATGGIGLHSLGGGRYGGKGYFYILAAVAGYFALTSQRIPLERAGAYVSLFFLISLSVLIPNLIYSGGSGLYFLYNIFPVSLASEQAAADFDLPGASIHRIGGLAAAGLGLFCFLLARYGARGILTKPLAFLAFLASAAASAASGFRSSLILFVLTFGAAFFIEGLHRTRWMPRMLVLGMAAMGFMITSAERLPTVVQRAISFLPVKVDPIVRVTAEGSTDWRLEIWSEVLPLVPRYFFKGKGYVIDPRELYNGYEIGGASGRNVYYGTIVAGDYHSGPLTLVIPFGIFGVLAFGWFVFASMRLMRYYCRFGDPNLRNINTCLLSVFGAKFILFLFVFGSFYSDLFNFTGLIGLAVSLNGPRGELAEEKVVEEEEFPEGAFEGFR